MARILIVEDDKKLARVMALHLTREGHEPEVAYALDMAKQHLRDHQPEIIISDLMIGDDSGLDLLSLARAEPQAPDVVFVTAHAGADTAAQAMRDGAYEYLTKPFSVDEIAALVRRINERRLLVAENRKLRDNAGSAPAGDLVVASAEMRKIMVDVDRIAGMSTTVFVRGETGTGKEEIARQIHRRGPRADGPFVAVNCGAIPEDLLASELFGHEKGAFTSAAARRVGAFERASGGTLFLDEIGDMPEATQSYLLRVIETKEITRVGGDCEVPVDVRLIAATHQDIETLIERGIFREDLYYRINVFPITVPPLRDRTDDILPLAKHFLAQFGGRPEAISDAAAAGLQAYRWPGNVRELRNVVENLHVRGQHGSITGELVDEILGHARPATQPPGEEETLEAAEARKIRQALEKCNGSKSDAARLLGITRRRLYSRIKILGLDA